MGMYIGGTGSNNHYDDYEEGVWTPSDASGSNVTITQTASNSKLLVSSSIHYGVSGRSLIGFTLYDGSTEITAANSTAGTTDNYFMVQHVHTSSTKNQTYSVFNLTNTFLYDGFGDTNAHTIKVYADTPLKKDPEEMGKALLERVKSGFEFLKMDIGLWIAADHKNGVVNKNFIDVFKCTKRR